MASLSYLEIAINGDLSQFITCVVSEAAEPVDLDNSQEYAERLASLVIAQVPSLRYISLGFGSMTYSFSIHTHPFAGMMWMWKVEHGGGERTLSPIPPNIAQRLRVVLKSPNYHPQRESEGEPSLPLRAHGSVDIIDAPYSHGMRLVSMAGKCSKFHLPPQ